MGNQFWVEENEDQGNWDAVEEFFGYLFMQLHSRKDRMERDTFPIAIIAPTIYFYSVIIYVHIRQCGQIIH